jgi:tetratricopeptide (TPR) repeat protein
LELTLDQALQKGIEAHKAGQVQEADRLYTAILQAQPKHPDANHNMGVLAVGVGKVQEALPFFKTALEVNPDTAQYWLSYIDALIKLERLTDAKAVLDQAKAKGSIGDSFDQLLQKLEGEGASPIGTGSEKNRQDPPRDRLQPIINLYSQGQFEKALRQASQLLKQFSKSVTLYNISGAAYRAMGQLDVAIDSFNKAISLKPDYADTYNNMGNALKDQGKLEEAIAAYNKALSIKPDYAEVYYNMSNALKEQGKLEEAIEAYKKALSLKPDYSDAYNNMGNALREQGKLEKAIEAYNKALSIKPDYADAYNNMGNVFHEQGKLEEAIEAYNKALSLKPDYADAYNNMGISLHEQGKLEDAIGAYKKAIAIKPDFAQAWNNIVFPLQTIKTQKLFEHEIASYYPADAVSKYAQIAKSILHYRLNIGGNTLETSLDEALSLLSSTDSITICDPKFDRKPDQPAPVLPNKIVALVHFGRSGTGLIHSLIDGHSEVSTLPSIYLSDYFDQTTWEKIIAGGWSEMADRFIAIYEVLFDASSGVPVKTKSQKLKYNIGKMEGMANVGENQNEVLSVDKKMFREELNRLMDFYDELDAFVFFKLANVAVDKAINDLKQKSLIFYHIHNPDAYAQLNFVRSAPTANWVMMVREPILSCESWIGANSTFDNNDHSGVSAQIISMLFEVDNIIYHKQRSIGIRLEDLKERPRQTIPALCKWMGIEETESLYEMTAQGKKWWGDPSSPDYTKDGMEPFGKTSIKRKVGSIFSESDQFIFRTLFYPFCVRFGYAEENLDQFKIDLQTIKPMLEQMFDFEKTIVERTQADPKRFMKSGSYLYLRSGLIERWNTLNKFHTYPNMITPLEIG